MSDHLTELNNAVDLPGIVAELYPESKAMPGRTATVYAVWRNNVHTPAFSLYKKAGVWFWKDHGNSGLDETSGNAFQFLTEIHGWDKDETIEYLERKTGIGRVKEQFRTRSIEKSGTVNPAFCLNLPLPEEVITPYREMFKETKGNFPKALDNRGLSIRDMDYYGLINSNDDVIIPIKNPDSKLVSFKRRYHNPPMIDGKPMRYKVETNEHGTPAWTNPTFKKLSERYGNVIIIEGELNAIAFDSVVNDDGWDTKGQFGGVLGLQGKDSGIYRGSLINKNVYLYLDEDKNYDRIIERYVEAAKIDGARSVYVIETFQGDFCDMANESRGTFYNVIMKAIRDAKRIYTDTDRIIGNMSIKKLLDYKEFLVDDSKNKVIHPYGFIELDGKTFGMPPTGLNLYAALSGHGKSTFIRQVLFHNMYDKNKLVKLYTSDESADLICVKMATYISGIPFDVIIKNLPHHRLLERYGTKEKIKKVWSDAYERFVFEFSKRFKIMNTNKVDVIIEDIEMEYDNGVSLFAIDYVQDLKIKGKRDDDATMPYLKDAAFKLNIPILLGAQLAKYKFSHDRVSGIPVTSDIDGTGAIYQYSESAIFNYNQDLYMKDFNLSPEWYRDYDTNLHGRARQFIHKSRMNGKGDVDLRFLGEVSTYKSLIDDGSGEVRM